MVSAATLHPTDDVLPRCGALVLDALLANDGITGVELNPKDNSLALRYDPRRTNRDHVEAIANLLRPALSAQGWNIRLIRKQLVAVSAT